MPWFGLVAEFAGDAEPAERRGAARRRLRFESVLNSSCNLSKVVVLDLSEAGLMLHTASDLAVGEIFELELPQVGIVEARVVWKRVSLYGCEFLSPVSRGSISAALLKATQDRPGEPPDRSREPPVRELTKD